MSRSVTSPSSAMPSLCGVLAMRFLSVSRLIESGENSVGNMVSPWTMGGPRPADVPLYHGSSALARTGAAPIRVAILRCSVARDAQRTGSTPRIPGALAPRLARDLPQHQADALRKVDSGL